MKLLNLLMGLLLSVGLLLSSGCGHQKISGNFTYESECLGVAHDGTQTLKSWGKGKNRLVAIEQAKKNALRDVLFKGINKGTNECNPRPLVPEVNAATKYEWYFNKFFAEGGDYKEFISAKDANFQSKRNIVVSKTEHGVVAGIVVTVLRNDLKNHLYRREILKK